MFPLDTPAAVCDEERRPLANKEEEVDEERSNVPMSGNHTILRTVAGLGVVACLLPGCQRLLPWRAAAVAAPAASGVVFDAADVLPPEQLRGRGYIVADRVPVVDHNFSFCIRTRFGKIPAHGRNMLELRLHEVQCIEQAAQIRGVRRILEGMFGALDETVEGAETLLTDPVGSIERAPKGLERMVKGKLDYATRRAGSPERRQLALALGCDPETRNPILKRMLDEIELQRLIGSLPVQFIPYTGIFRLTADIKDEVASTPPHEINERIERELANCGAPKGLRRSFCRSKHFTAVQRLLLMQHYRELSRTKNCNALLELAVEGNSEADALGAIEVGQALARLHAQRPLAELMPRGLPVAGLRGLPIAVLEDGRHLIYAPYDCIVGTEQVDSAVTAYRAACPLQPTTLMCSGQTMPDARRALEAARITVEERARFGR